jgi:hypothetical protein
MNANRMTTTRRRWPWPACALALALCWLPARAIINPSFTPKELVRSSQQIHRLDVSAPPDGENAELTARVIETLKGDKLPAMTLRLQVGSSVDPEELRGAFAGRKTATALLFLGSGAGGQDEDTEAGGGEAAILIGTAWFALERDGADFVLEEDELQRFAIWGGSARMLAAVTRYAQADPWAMFPVRSDLVWREDSRLATLPGPANGSLLMDLSAPTGRVVAVLSDAGDRLFAAAHKDGKPQDVTAKLNLTTASKRMTPADLTGNGRLDLVSWDGESILLSERAEDGRFAAPRKIAPLKECLSLYAVGVEHGRTGLLIGTGSHPLLLAPDDKQGFVLRPLAEASTKPTAAQLGPGGYCVAADLTGNGRADVLQLHARGALFYAGQSPGRFESPVVIEAALPGNPRAVVCGDFANDGTLDVMVGGDNGVAYLSRHDSGRWENLLNVTYELAHHGNHPNVVALLPADVNSDGRQGVALFYADRKPMLFFNRGFACFGWARELDPDPIQHVIGSMPDDHRNLDGMKTLARGQSTGVVADLTGDGLADLLAVASNTHEVWLINGARADHGPVFNLEIALAPSENGPVTVSVREEDRVRGMYVARPGRPVRIGRSEAGPVTLEWTAPDGAKKTRQVIVERPHQRVELTPQP